MTRIPTCSLRVLDRTLAVVRLDARAAVPDWAENDDFFCCVRTREELSIVCDADAVPPGATEERGFACLGVVGPLSFGIVGLLAELSGVLADAGVALLAISSFDTDYLLVRHTDLERAVAALRAAGHHVEGSA